jgi:hypothetical protein
MYWRGDMIIAHWNEHPKKRLNDHNLKAVAYWRAVLQPAGPNQPAGQTGHN